MTQWDRLGASIDSLPKPDSYQNKEFAILGLDNWDLALPPSLPPIG